MTIVYILLFILIQLVSLALTIIGWPLIAVLATLHLWTPTAQIMKTNHVVGPLNWRWKGGALTWLWCNEEDGIFGPPSAAGVYPAHTAWRAFYWSAIRNSADNLRFVPGVSKPGRPLWYYTWTWTGHQFYYKFGWQLVTGWPCASIGGGRGY